MALGAATAVARDVTQSIPVGNGEPICLAHFGGRASDIGRQQSFGSQLIAVLCRLKSTAAGKENTGCQKSFREKISSVHVLLSLIPEAAQILLPFGCGFDLVKDSEKHSSSFVNL
jgi:hypothetical protein